MYSETKRLISQLRRRAIYVVSGRRRSRRRAYSTIFKHLGPVVVRRGPFEGVQLPYVTTGSHAPKTLGTYELELHDEIELLIQRSPSTVVNVGAGEGLYAIGLARRLPDAIIHSYDTSPEAQKALRKNAEANGVADRVVIGGWCEAAELARFGPTSPLVVVDCEGGEEHLLTAATIAALASATFLIETHDFLEPGVRGRLLERLGSSHAVSEIAIQPRLDFPPELAGLSHELANLALAEHRATDQAWIIARPLSQDVSHSESTMALRH